MLVKEITKAWQYFQEHGFKATLLARDTPFLIQFGKYGFCGVLSLITFLIVTTLGQKLWPTYFSLDLPPSQRALHLVILHFIAFVPANFTAFALNRWLVFTPGRHSFRKELTLFSLISFLSFGIGEILPVWLVRSLNVPNYAANISFIVSSALVNFVCRKFFVFEK